jgi:hypothetical protein
MSNNIFQNAIKSRNMETIYVLTHLVMIICAGVVCFSMEQKIVEEKSLTEALNFKRLAAIIKIKNKQLGKKIRKALHSGSPGSHFNIANGNRFQRVNMKATVLKLNESINSAS